LFKGLSHVVIAVRDLEASISQYEALYGVKAGEIRQGQGNGFRSVVLDFAGAPYLELISPTDTTGPVGRRVEASGEGVYMIAMKVESMDETVAALRDQGVRLLGDPGPGNPVRGQVFIHPQAAGGVLTLLTEH
jgi:methylmalonyl-CoA epimerase